MSHAGMWDSVLGAGSSRPLQLAAVCCGLAILSLLLEALRAARTTLTDTTGHTRWRNYWHWCQAFLHVIQVLLQYMLMLAVMSENLWAIAAVCLGAGLGYLVFAPLPPPPPPAQTEVATRPQVTNRPLVTDAAAEGSKTGDGYRRLD